MKKELLICSLEDFDDPGSLGFDLQIEGQQIRGFMVYKDGQVYAYRNACPHTGSPLDWVEHQFLDLDQAFIQCAVHDARFEMESGLCIAGPCSGDSLQKLDVVEVDQEVYLVEPSLGVKP